jgi:endonuclease YncB( thermonuclease family)
LPGFKGHRQSVPGRPRRFEKSRSIATGGNLLILPKSDAERVASTMETKLRRKSRWQPALTVLALAACINAASAEESCLAGALEVHATGVADPRSIMLEDGRVLRLAGIETFALLAPDAGGAEAALVSRLGALIKGTPLYAVLFAEETDRYGRFPAMIAAGGRLIQETLTREGLAIAYPGGEPLPCSDRILAAEEEARRARRGYWIEPLPQAWPEALSSRIGRFAIFEGRVVSVGNRRDRTYLNFGRRWATDVTAEIEAADREGFGGEAALSDLAGRRVRIRGYLEEKAGPMVVVRSPLQIELIGSGTVVDGVSP